MRQSIANWLFCDFFAEKSWLNILESGEAKGLNVAKLSNEGNEVHCFSAFVQCQCASYAAQIYRARAESVLLAAAFPVPLKSAANASSMLGTFQVASFLVRVCSSSALPVSR
jgi:hypothetical protein